MDFKENRGRFIENSLLEFRFMFTSMSLSQSFENMQRRMHAQSLEWSEFRCKGIFNMKGSRKLIFRVPEDQYKTIKNRMEFRGYMNLSQYARDRLRSKDLLTIKLLKKSKK